MRTDKESILFLKATPHWPAFETRRGALIEAGLSEKEAFAHALSDFEPVIADREKQGPVVPAEKPPHKEAPDSACPAEKGPPPATEKKVEPEPEEEEAEERHPTSSKLPDKIKTKTQYKKFMSKEADVVEQVMWVAKHLDVDDKFISLDDIPCPEAWSMLLSYRKSDERRKEFWDKIYPKLIPSRSQLDAGGAKKVDGAMMIKVIERIQKIRAAAKKSVGAA